MVKVEDHLLAFLLPASHSTSTHTNARVVISWQVW
jgi:hypothetical protein